MDQKDFAAVKRILEALPTAAAIYTEDLRLDFCNRAFLDTCGAQDGGDLTGRPYLQAGRERYYQLSGLPEAVERLKRGTVEVRGVGRYYTALREEPVCVLELLTACAAAPMVPLSQRDAGTEAEHMILSDKRMRSTLETIHRISGFDSTVLITGESGTGKTMLARYIHDASRRADAPFVTINCASIPENLIESELFGYVSGAFTGAGQRGKIGLVETADGGTLFLDEIGTLPPHLQGKFLQLVQEKTYFPVGGIKQKRADVRIISASNQDLKKLVEEGLFREDLYYRLRVIEFYMPPLRERRDAIEPLIDYFLSHYNRCYQMTKTISPKAREVLKRYSWNGNIRELQYVIERALVTSADSCVQAEDIPPLQGGEEPPERQEEQSFQQAVEACERKLLRRAYQKYGSSYKVAAALGLSQTKASRLLRKYHIC